MLRKLALTSLVLACGLGVAHADIWRWKDSQGIFHYSDQWVPGSELIKANRYRPPTEEVDVTRSLAGTKPPPADKLEPDIAQPSAATVQSVKQDVAKLREQQCKDAKDAYQKAIQARRIFKSADKTGERQYLSDAEADTYRAQVRSDMDSFCGAAAK